VEQLEHGASQFPEEKYNKRFIGQAVAELF
jgi:hypothetical protein